MIMRKLAMSGLLAFICLSGCKVGPDYRRPIVAIPDVYHGPRQNQEEQAESFADLPWWQVFQDPVLQDLIRKAEVEKIDLSVLAARQASTRSAGASASCRSVASQARSMLPERE